MTEYTLVTDIDTLYALLDDIEASQGAEAALDCETTGFVPEAGRVRLAQIATDAGCWVVDFDAMGVPFNGIAEEFEGIRWWAFNMGFEYSWFRAAGAEDVEVCDVYNLRKACLGGGRGTFAALIKETFDVALSKEEQASDWGAAELTPSQLEYAALDAIWTWKAVRHWQAEVDAQPERSGAVDLFNGLLRPVTEMQETGLLMDQRRHRDLVAHWEHRRAGFEQTIREYVGESEVENLNSRPQWSDFFGQLLPDEVINIWPKTEKSGQLQISSDALGLMAVTARSAGSEDLAKLMDAVGDRYGIQQYLSNFGDKLLTMADLNGGRIYPRYNIAAAVTGRFSCSQPNAQQLPRDRKLLGEDTSVRSSFIAPPGRALVAIDYSGIELRVLALLSGDEQLLYDCTHGDLHSEVAAFQHGHKIDKTLPEHKEKRSGAKGISFGIIYGAGPPGIASTMRDTVSRAVEIIDFWSDRYPKAFALRNQMQAHAEANDHYLPMIDGGTIHLGKRVELPKCANYPVQRAALTIMARALIRHEERLRKLNTDAWLAATIHDAAIGECREDLAEDHLQWLAKDMQDAYLDVFPSATTDLLMEGGHGDCWGTIKDYPLTVTS